MLFAKIIVKGLKYEIDHDLREQQAGFRGQKYCVNQDTWRRNVYK